jgi:hypothetical protein
MLVTPSKGFAGIAKLKDRVMGIFGRERLSEARAAG